MEFKWKNKLIVGGIAATLSLGGLAGCGDGKDQDNGIDDGEVDDQLDPDNNPANENNNPDDGLDQNNGIGDGEIDDQLDPDIKSPEGEEQQ